MKLNGFVGKGSGKLGSSVFAISGGEQIVRQYNPQVSNPQTDAQVAQRAKFKLLSQLAAVLAPAMAFKKDKLTSARNQFIAANIGFATFSEGSAEMDLLKLTLTGKNGYFPAFDGNVDQNHNLGLELTENASAIVDAVVYVVTEPTEGDQLLLKAVKLVTTPGASGTFNTSVPNMAERGTVWAYGVKFNSASQKVKFENYVLTGGLDGARLSTDVLSALLAGDATMTKGLIIEP